MARTAKQFEQLPGLETGALTELVWDTRFHILLEDQGFYPTTTSELNHAFAVMATADHPAGVASHLNEVFLRQRSLINLGSLEKGKDRAAVMSIVRSYEAYAIDAQALLASAGNVAFVTTDARPETLLKDAVGIYSDEPAITELTRLQVLEEAVRLGNRSALTSHVTKSEDGAIAKEITRSDLYDPETLRQFALGLPVEEADAWLAKVIATNRKRFDFWVTPITQAYRFHLVVRGLAGEVLDGLGVERPSIRRKR